MLDLADVRPKLAAVLAPVADDDPAVLDNLVDALEPPALMLAPGNPWLEPDTACLWVCRQAVMLFAGRYEPGAGIEEIERLTAYAIGRTKADVDQWPVVGIDGARKVDFGGITYLAGRVTYRLRVTIGGA